MTKSPIRISFLCFFSLSAELQVIFKFRVNTKFGMNYYVGAGNFSNRTCKTAEPNSMKTETSQPELSLQRLDRTVTRPEPSQTGLSIQPLGPNWDETRTFSDWTYNTPLRPNSDWTRTCSDSTLNTTQTLQTSR